MKIIIHIILFVFGLTAGVQAQSNFIIAGVQNTTDYYHDVVPDTTFAGMYYSSVNYFVDMDNDGIKDIKFSSSYGSNPGGFFGFGGVTVDILTGAILEDAANPGYTTILNLNDTIKNSPNWVSDTTIDLSYYYWTQCPPMCPPENIQINTSEENKYIGYRMITPDDTLYGWIKFDVYSYTMTVKEWALNISYTNSNGIEISVYPNPAINAITIKAPKESIIEIHNTAGQLIRTLVTTSNKTNLDVFDLRCGLYLVKVKTEKEVAVRKFMKE